MDYKIPGYLLQNMINLIVDNVAYAQAAETIVELKKIVDEQNIKKEEPVVPQQEVLDPA
jgi:acyl CoA:acetate/3-ketoacid CoA transferase alpha subunit